MLNRRILRIKAFKTLYSFAENPSMTLQEAQAQLEISCEATRDLYIFLLGIIPALTREASERIEAARSKFNPTEEEKHPNLKFVHNAISPLIEEDPDFQKIFKKKKFSWDQYDVLLRNLYDSIRRSDYFADYLSSQESSIKEDGELWATIFEREFPDNAELETILEDLSIWWNDDLEYSLSWCCRTMDELGKGKRWNLPPLFQSDFHPGSDSDKSFVQGIVRKGVTNFEKYYESIAQLTPKWDKNRICTPDLCLIVAGLAENEAFPRIDARITINEFVEISKFYSSPESRAFVNGLLDKLINKNK